MNSAPHSTATAKSSRWLLPIMFGLALLIRLHHITQMPDDFHPARQYRSASIAQAFYSQLHRQSGWEHDMVAMKQFQDGLLEPPILEWVSVAAYSGLGGEKLWIPRTFSVFFWLMGGCLLYRLARELTHQTAALISLAFFLFVPYGILGSRSFQPEPFMVMLLLGLVYQIHCYYQNPTGPKLLGAALLAAFTFLVKPTSVFAGAAVFGCLSLYCHGWRRTLTHAHVYLFALISLLPALLYYGWGLLQVDKIQDQAAMSFIPQLLGRSTYWSGWIRMIGRTVGLLPFFIGLAGIWFFPRDRRRVLVGALFLSYFIYGLIFNYHIHTHDYYSLQLIPTVALALGPIALVLYQWLRNQWGCSPWRLLLPVGLGCAVAVLAMLWFKAVNLKQMNAVVKDGIKSSLLLVGLSPKVFMFVRPDYYNYDRTYQNERRVGELVKHSHKTVLLSPDGSLPIVYKARISGKPWPDRRQLELFALEGRPPLSARERYEKDFQPANPEYFIITEFSDYENQPDLKEFLEASFPVYAASGRDYLIFSLQSGSKQKSAGTP